MKKSTERTFVLFVRFPILLSTFTLLGMGAFSQRGFLDWNRMRGENAKVLAKISSVQDQKAQLERQIRLFETNRSEQERVVRQVLGYIKQNEMVVEFD